MLLHVNPDLGEVPGFAGLDKAQLLRSVELRRQQLEKDIDKYIQLKQKELRDYEQELLDRCRPPKDDGDKSEPADDVKKTKHTRVQKRERELYGLVTPVFLPLMESPPTPKREKKPKQERTDDAPPASASAPAPAPAPASASAPTTSPSRDAAQSKPLPASAHMSSPVEPTKKARRWTKKSALRSNNTPRPRRKRVSLVIDDQIVLPADTIVEPPLTSPSETSASNSTASLDECIDPRLTHIEALPQDPTHHDAVHHSLPVTMTYHSSSPTKPPHTSLPSAPMSLDSDSPPIHIHTPYKSTLARVDDILEEASYAPAHKNNNTNTDDDIPEEEQDFSTYVGGISGSGASDVNQVGSYGYPSSLGASYLESYMMSRPLSVRMAAAEKAELDQEERRILLEKKEEEEEFEMDGIVTEKSGGEDEDDFMGNMDDF